MLKRRQQRAQNEGQHVRCAQARLVEAGAHGPQFCHGRLPSVAAQRHAEVHHPARPVRPGRRDELTPLVPAMTVQY